MSNHLVENFKDRVPRQVLPNGAVRYEEFDENGNSLGYKWIKRADDPTEVGNAWNKYIYDGIKAEFGDVLYTAEKATQAEAEAGVDDTKYMTSLKVNQAISQRLVTRSYDIDVPTTNQLNLRVDLDSYVNENTVLVVFESYINQFAFDSDGSWMDWLVNSENPVFGLWIGEAGRLHTSSMSIVGNRYKSHTKMIIDVKSKLVKIVMISGTLSAEVTKYELFRGTYLNNIGKIFPRFVKALSSKDFIKVKAFDSAEISNM